MSVTIVAMVNHTALQLLREGDATLTVDSSTFGGEVSYYSNDTGSILAPQISVGQPFRLFFSSVSASDM